jgi:hypothetical protein
MEICNGQDRLHDVPLEEPSRLTENAEKVPREEVSTLRQLIDALHEAFQTDHVNIDHVQDLMTSYKSDFAEWKKFAKFDRYRYNRRWRNSFGARSRSSSWISLLNSPAASIGAGGKNSRDLARILLQFART